MKRAQLGIGIGLLVLAVVYATGAVSIKVQIGYSGVGPNFLPWVVAIALALCGGTLCWQAASGGFRSYTDPTDGVKPGLPGWAWVSVGLIGNALLLTTLGFIVSCAILFVLASRGFRTSMAALSRPPVAQTMVDFATGLAIAAPVYWMFTKGLGISLPGLLPGGWV